MTATIGLARLPHAAVALLDLLLCVRDVVRAAAHAPGSSWTNTTHGSQSPATAS